LLNLGFRLPAAAGTDAMANFASLRGPVGLNRVYVKVPSGPLNIVSWLNSLKQGHTFATDGPLLGFTLGDKGPGDEITISAVGSRIKFTARMGSAVPVDRLQIVCNGSVVRELKLNGDRESANVQDFISISRSGWCLLRGWSEKAEYPILDSYPYATTSPIYVNVAGSAPKSPQDAAYFLAWIDRLIENAKSNQDWNTDAERLSVLSLLDQAKSIYLNLQK
jgi:TolB protein